MISEIVWAVIFSAALTWELVGVFYEKRYRIEPLTRIVRDRLMRKHITFKLAFLFFWTWLGAHFLLPGF